MIEIKWIKTFQTNYVWWFRLEDGAYVVDPGDAAPVLAALQDATCPLAGILVTHHHADHAGGIAPLSARFPSARVYGPPTIAGVTHPLADGDTLALGALHLTAIATPGHTLDHLCYAGTGVLFCGDTLFGAGCGRLFEGTPAQLFASLQRLRQLPAATRVYPAHEYTQDNLRFALACDPDNPAVTQRVAQASWLQAQGIPTLPSTMQQELASNPFLRCHTPDLHTRCAAHAGHPLATELDTFAALRRWKDTFH